MSLSVLALGVGVVAPVAALASKLRSRPPRLSSYRKILLPQQPMLRLVVLEISRAQRNDTSLSMIIFAKGQGASVKSIEFLEKVLPEKIRLSDAAGWISENELAVLLPETSASGARTFVSTLRKLAGGGVPLPPLSIWRHEGKWVAEPETPIVRPAEPPKMAMSA